MEQTLGPTLSMPSHARLCCAPVAGLKLSARTDILGRLSASPKAIGLVELMRLGLPTPPAYALHAPTLLALHRHGEGEAVIEDVISELEIEVGVGLGEPVEPGKPFLLAVRAGSKRHATLPPSLIHLGDGGMLHLTRTRDAERWDQLARFEAATGRLGMFRTLGSRSPRRQVALAVVGMAEAVGAQPLGGDPWVIIQQMCFGDVSRASCAGMAYSRNPHTGLAEDFGRFLMNASGVRYSRSAVSERRALSDLETVHPKLLRSLRCAFDRLEAHYDAPRYVEFVCEENVLFLVQNMASRHPWPLASSIKN